MVTIDRWALVFRILSNVNRLKIIKMLSSGDGLNVGDIAGRLKISFHATSKHLIILRSLDVLDSRGTRGHIFYSINKKMSTDFKKAISVFM